MRYKKWLIYGGPLLALLAGVVLVLVFVLRHEPSFYKRGAVPPGSLRKHYSDGFVTESTHLYNVVTSAPEPKWHATFTEAQINSFFAEDFIHMGMAGKMLPAHVSAPRVALEQDKVRLGFRYGHGFWSTVISVVFRVWMAAKEPNVIVLELEAVHAGALPIAPQPLLEQISEVLRGPNVNVTWYRNNNHPTAVIQFRSENDRPTAVLRQLDLQPGVLTVVGKALEGPLGPVSGPPPALVPQAN